MAYTDQGNLHPTHHLSVLGPHILPSALPFPMGDKGFLAVPQNSPLYCCPSLLLHPPQGFDQLSPSQGGAHMLKPTHFSISCLINSPLFFPYNSSSSNTQLIIFIVICLLQINVSSPRAGICVHLVHWCVPSILNIVTGTQDKFKECSLNEYIWMNCTCVWASYTFNN